MNKLQLTDTIHCSVDAFWTAFLDAELQQQIFTAELGYPSFRVSDRRESDGSVTRRIEITPKLELPAAAKKIVGSMFSYVEEGELRDGVYRFKLSPPQGIESARASFHGEMRAEAMHAGSTRRILDLTSDVRMPLVGKMLEGVAIQALKDGYAAHAVALNGHLERQRNLRSTDS